MPVIIKNILVNSISKFVIMVFLNDCSPNNFFFGRLVSICIGFLIKSVNKNIKNNKLKK
jgi:multisubunit Na+/H+ antiporter MnhE subunit